MTQSVQDFYNNADAEWDRLESAYSRLEYLTTLHLIEKYFPPTGRVIDVGGGPGRYTIALLQRGYHVSLVDLSPDHVEMAQTKIAALGLTADSITQADARDLSAFPDSSFDAGLLMGPLYHLHDPADRAAVIREFYRVLKPGAVGIAAYLNAWGLIQTGMIDFPERYEDPDFLRSMLDQGGLGIWYWTNPERAQAEVKSAGFEVVSYAGAEGAAGGAPMMLKQLAADYPAAYKNFARFAVETCEMHPFRDTCNHLHIVVRKPG
jgi:ubiquinone/menaquinone biosynthesis C-methylase UbiE